MPKEKDLKRLVRRRMEKTGESYTAARAQLVGKARLPALPDDHEKIAGMSDDAVRARTGKDWREWAETLDQQGAASMAHRDIAKLLAETYEVPDWWAQMITVGYERFRGLRDVGQRRGGGYEVSKSKTVEVGVSELFRAFADETVRERWLPGAGLVVRTATTDRSMRMRWPDDTPVDAYFTAKGERKSSVSVQHRKLPDEETSEKHRSFWAERLAALAAMLTEG